VTTLAVRALLAAAVALGFAAAGEAVLGRRSRSVAEANAALVAGMGASAAALFPLTLVAPRLALDAVLLLLAAAVILAAWRRRRGKEPPRARPVRTPAALAPLLLAVLAGIAFAALDLRYNLLWDGFAIWTSKAQRLFVQGGLERGWYAGETYDTRLAAYPGLVPLYEALVARLLGRFDFDAFKPIFVIFQVSMAVSVFTAVRARASARLASWAAVLVLFVPALSTRWAAGAYADLPLAAVVAAATAEGLRGDANALPWLIGALTTVKPEGTVLAGLAALAIAAAAWPSLRAGFARRAAVRFVVVLAAFAAARVGYQRWTHVRDDVYVFQSVGIALERVPEVARLCLRELFDPRAWGLLWPAFLAAGVVLLRRGSPAERALAVSVAAGVAAMAAPFLFTTWPVPLHVEQAYFRLLAQLAPAAVVAIVIGYVRAAEAANRAGEPRAAVVS
jgi:hypothetical protein